MKMKLKINTKIKVNIVIKFYIKNRTIENHGYFILSPPMNGLQIYESWWEVLLSGIKPRSILVSYQSVGTCNTYKLTNISPVDPKQKKKSNNREIIKKNNAKLNAKIVRKYSLKHHFNF